MPFSEFAVLGQFSQTLANLRVTTSDRGGVPLLQGMNEACDRLGQMRAMGTKAILVGNGGSAAIASHHANDFGRNAGLRAIAFNDGALITCLANDYGYEEAFAQAVRLHGDSGDALIAISSSGKSPNILHAVLEARKRGIFTITFSGFAADNPLLSLGHLNFHVPSESYGIVETAHLLLLHAFVERLASTYTEDRHGEPHPRSSLPTHTPHQAN
jgi:D-sedoheptulose 7-phosphate isomerase